MQNLPSNVHIRHLDQSHLFRLCQRRPEAPTLQLDIISLGDKDHGGIERRTGQTRRQILQASELIKILLT